MHRLLAHLRAAGFDGAPLSHGIDDQGREILEFVPGIAGSTPWPAFLASEDAVRSVGKLLRRFHDASSGFVWSATDAWFVPARAPHEVICHGDLSLDNIIFRDGVAAALIDFDVAHPGPRLWDLAWALYCLAPLHPAEAHEADERIASQCRRARAFASGYGLDAAQRAALAHVAGVRLDQVALDIEALADRGIAAFIESRAAGHPAMFRAHAAHIRANSAMLNAALEEVPAMHAALAQRYDADMLANYQHLESTCGYRAGRFLYLVNLLGGVAATNMALDLTEPPGGFHRLREMGQLARSVEAWCLRPEYAPLFSAERRAVARARLEMGNVPII